MKLFFSSFILLSIGLYIKPYYISAQQQCNQTTLGIWLYDEALRGNAEIRALEDFFNQHPEIKCRLIAPEEIKSIKDLEQLWIIKNDTFPFSGELAKEGNKKAILRFLKKGGDLVLLNQAAGMTSILDIEPLSPITVVKPTLDEGYGRMLGYHAFRKHPLFDGLNGGAYVLKAEKDTNVFQTGYFGEPVPQKGRVIAVDWDYIFLREDKKMIIEYDYGKGKVLTVGGYMLYSLPNRNRQHLEKFTLNIVNYLKNRTSGQNKVTEAGMNEYHWNYGLNKVLPFKSATEKIEIENRQSSSFMLEDDLPYIKRDSSSGNYWDVAGERMLVMGTDRGGITEIWSHPFMCLRDYEIGIRFFDTDSVIWLIAGNPQVTTTPYSYERVYSYEKFILKEIITADPAEPLVLVHYEFEGEKPAEMVIRFRSNFRYMWPYSEKVLENLYHTWSSDLNAFVIKDESGDFVSCIGSALRPLQTLAGQYETIDYNGSAFSISLTDKFQLSGIMTVNLEHARQLDIIITATDQGEAETISAYRKAIADPESIYKKAKLYAETFSKNMLSIDGPDDEFNKGIFWAEIATDKFFVNTPGIGKSIVAGYATSDKGWDGGRVVSGRPGYGWYFGRDGAWSAFAMLDYGDFEKVRSVLETFQRFQDLNGKIFHELSTSGFAHYDAADATPLYIILAGQYLKHSGDLNFIKMSWPSIKKAIDFCFSTDTDEDHLIENTNVGHGWEEGGHLFGCHTTLYLASCWAEALEEAAYITKYLGSGEEEYYRKEAGIVRDIINTDFWNNDGNYYYHGKYKDGSYLSELTIMPAIPMLFGQSDNEKSARVMDEFASNSFTSDWGCRIVPEQSEHFNPEGYHTGSVWPLFTGWASLAEYKYGNYLQGHSHVMNNLLIYRHWGLGFIEEVLNGKYYRPSGVCHHQCWSETMALQPALEGMLGLKCDAMKSKLMLSPWFPADWDSVSVKNIRIGRHEVDLKTIRKDGMTIFEFNHRGDTTLIVRFAPVFPPATQLKTVRINGQPAREPAFDSGKDGWKKADFEFRLDSAATVVIKHQGGISALPAVPFPVPGDESRGFRILSTSYNNGTYKVLLQGRSSAREELKIWTADHVMISVENGKIIKSLGAVSTIEVVFPNVDADYSTKELIIHYH